MSIFLFIYQYRHLFFYSFYAIATCFKKKSATRSLVRMHGYPTRAFDSSLVTYIERDVLKIISNDIILGHFQQIKNRLFFM